MRILHPAATLFLLTVAPLHAEGVGTAFTYQGLLEKPAGTMVQDVCAFSFSLCDAEGGACNPGTVSSHPAVSVAFGVFTVTDVDFGLGSITGEARWMEIAVKCTGDADFATLAPRVELKPSPYSVRAVEGVGPPTGIQVTPDGDVGIGTTAPQAQLDVNGAARATTMEITGGSSYPPYPLPLVAWGANYAGQLDGPPYSYLALAAGNTHALGIRVDGTLVEWGNNGGNGNPPLGTFIDISAGNDFSVGIASNGALVGWGWNNQGQTNVPFGTFVSVDAGPYHGLAIRADGTLAAWGQNGAGQASVPSGTYTAVAGGGNFSIAIRENGTLIGWGENVQGVLDVPSGTFVALDAGYNFVVALRSDGTLVAWGGGGAEISNVPSGTFIGIAAGWYHALAIRSDGTVVGWGENDYEQTAIPEGTFSTIAAGHSFGLAVRNPSESLGAALRLHVDSAIKPGSNTWTIFSDRRLKKDIAPLDGALERLLQLQGVTFHWRDPATQGGITGLQIGLIADEVQRVFPQWVGRDPKGYQTLTVGGFEALTAEAMRELREEKDCEIENLKSEISGLKEMVKELVEGIEKSKSPKVQTSKNPNKATRQPSKKAMRQ